MREEVGRQKHEIDAQRSQVTSFRAEAAALRDRWLEDVSRLENEKVELAARAEEEHSILRQKLADAMAQAAQQHGVRRGSSGAVEEAIAAAQKAEEEGIHVRAQNSLRLSALQNALEASVADSVRTEELRNERLAGLQAEHTQLKQKWKQAAQALVASSTAASRNDELPPQETTAYQNSGSPTNLSTDSSCVAATRDMFHTPVDGQQTDNVWPRCLSWDLLEPADVLGGSPGEVGTGSDAFPGLRPPSATPVPR